MSDVLVGGAVGSGIGFGVPILLHYGGPGHRALDALTIAPTGDTSQQGVVVSGVF